LRAFRQVVRHQSPLAVPTWCIDRGYLPGRESPIGPLFPAESSSHCCAHPPNLLPGLDLLRTQTFKGLYGFYANENLVSWPVFVVVIYQDICVFPAMAECLPLHFVLSEMV
jgi:hypothetical protein